MSEPNSSRFSRRAMLRYSAVGLAAVGGGALLGACQTTDPSTGQASGGASLQERIDSGEPVRIAIANEPPYTKLTSEGELTGAAPDVAKAVLKRMGITNLEAKKSSYGNMIPGLQADRWDIVATGLFMNTSRCADVTYSSPVIVSTESLAVPAGNPKNLTAVDDIKNSDVRIAVLTGSFELKTAKSLGVAEDKLPTYSKATDALQAMNAERVDAILLPTLSLNSLKEQRGAGFEITEPLAQFPTTGSGAAFLPSDKDFHGKYNKELEAFKKTQEFDDILSKWGFSGEAARKATTEQLCANEG